VSSPFGRGHQRCHRLVVALGGIGLRRVEILRCHLLFQFGDCSRSPLFYGSCCGLWPHAWSHAPGASRRGGFQSHGHRHLPDFRSGACTYQLGIFSIFGGFAGGVLFHRHREFVDAWRRQVGRLVLVFFLPVFFTYTGLRTNVLGLSTATDWQWLSIILAAAILSKVVPVYFVGRLCGFDRNKSSILGTLMIPGR